MGGQLVSKSLPVPMRWPIDPGRPLQPRSSRVFDPQQPCSALDGTIGSMVTSMADRASQRPKTVTS